MLRRERAQAASRIVADEPVERDGTGVEDVEASPATGVLPASGGPIVLGARFRCCRDPRAPPETAQLNVPGASTVGLIPRELAASKP